MKFPDNAARAHGSDLRLTEVQIERRLLRARAKKRDAKNAAFVRLGLKSNRERCPVNTRSMLKAQKV